MRYWVQVTVEVPSPYTAEKAAKERAEKLKAAILRDFKGVTVTTSVFEGD